MTACLSVPPPPSGGGDAAGNAVDAANLDQPDGAPAAGLIAWYGCDDFDFAPPDLSGNGHDGICGDACPGMAAGHVGIGACDFGGDLDHVQIPYDPAFRLASGFTIATYVSADALEGAFMSMPFDDAAANSWQLAFGGSCNSDILRFYSDPATLCGLSADDLPIFEWHHVAATWDGSVMSLYIDGSQHAMTSSETPFFDQHDLTFGGDYNGGVFADEFDGQLDDIRIYDRALTSGELAGFGP